MWLKCMEKSYKLVDFEHIIMHFWLNFILLSLSPTLSPYSLHSLKLAFLFQILEILHIPDKQVARQFLRVACSTITSMAGQYPDLTRQYVILPLIEPLVRCTENNGTSIFI